tara:strand:- start:1432 stop:2001 length:570 start_codon:yes stop_codon:yes gene_type:complete
VGCKKVLVACEFSGVVRDAFVAAGHDAMSCDLEPATSPGWHTQGDVRDFLNDGWDLMIAHPPCDHLAISGNRWYYDKPELRQAAMEFVVGLYESPVPMVAVENPVGRLSTMWRKPDQYVQPWMFGHGETKKTGLWLKNLPKLEPTDVVCGRKGATVKMPDSKGRKQKRSITYAGIAKAMAEQWGCLANV